MSLGKPDLYIGGELMQTAKGDPRPALAGLRIAWGSDGRLDPAPASKLSGQLLIKGAMPSFLEVGAPVGLVDPVSSRTLFAGTLEPMHAGRDTSVKSAHRVQFTATSPLSELVKHKVLDFDWPLEHSAVDRRNMIASKFPRGWTLAGPSGYSWINQGRLKFQSQELLQILQWYCNSYTMRYHDTSTYTPGAGLTKRLTLTFERNKGLFGATFAATARGAWITDTQTLTAATGVAALPSSAVDLEVEWEKTPEDVITDVQVSSWGGQTADPESDEFDYLMSAYVNNDALQDAYGFRQAKIETSLSAYNQGALIAMIQNIVNYWLDSQTKWRPTTLRLPDSRVLDTNPLLNLIAVTTRHMAVVVVPTGATSPGKIQSFVMAGEATWTGKKWITDLTLGRTL